MSRLNCECGETRAAAGEAFVVRLATPLEGQTVVEDELRGAVVFENANLDDPVLLKTNGLPTYHLAHIVDDHFMGITHVIRAEEWISSAPLHVVIYHALGWPVPRLVHVPDVLGREGGKKLSKRFGAIPILEYRDLGYLPEAVLNYMALLGWSYDGETDVLGRDELIAAFSLDRVGTAPARYDEERLLWLNGVYIRRLSLDDLTERALPFLERPEMAKGSAGCGCPSAGSRPCLTRLVAGAGAHEDACRGATAHYLLLHANADLRHEPVARQTHDTGAESGGVAPRA